MKVIINGYSGTMGQVLTKCVAYDEELELVAGISPKHHDVDGFNTYSSFADVKEDSDVVIDFSNPLALDGILEYCLKTKTPVVLATTGYNDEEMEKIHEAAKQIPVFLSFNMSLGVNILLKLVKEAAKNLANFDIEIIEKHHNKKLDAPSSGTAVMIANAVKEIREQSEFIYGRHGRTGKRQQNEVGIHAVRGGTIVGEHSAIFAGNDEILEINHSARSKNVFAEGAIAAAKYLVNQEPGFYNMDDMLG